MHFNINFASFLHNLWNQLTLLWKDMRSNFRDQFICADYKSIPFEHITVLNPCIALVALACIDTWEKKGRIGLGNKSEGPSVTHIKWRARVSTCYASPFWSVTPDKYRRYQKRKRTWHKQDPCTAYRSEQSCTPIGSCTYISSVAFYLFQVGYASTLFFFFFWFQHSKYSRKIRSIEFCILSSYSLSFLFLKELYIDINLN